MEEKNVPELLRLASPAYFSASVRNEEVYDYEGLKQYLTSTYVKTSGIRYEIRYRKITFTVPTGNFGDVFAGYVAMRMGLPVDRLVVATNVNDILVRVLATGDYAPRAVQATTSPSMDIQVSSNFERLLFDAYGRDAGADRGTQRARQSKLPAVTVPIGA